MLYAVRESNLPFYYAALEVRLTRNSDGIRMRMRLPITCANCEYECYQIYTFPVSWATLHHHVVWQTQEFLIVSRDRQTHATLSRTELSSCFHTTHYLCSTLILHTNTTECEMSLFLAETTTPPCPRVLVSLRQPIIQPVGNSFLFAVPQTVTATLVCHRSMSETESYRITLNNSGLVYNSSRCDVYAASMRISAQLHSTFHVTIPTFTLYLPELSFKIHHHEKLKNLPNTNDSDLLQSINHLLTQEHNQVALDRVASHIADWHQTKRLTTVVLPSAGSVIIIVMILIIVSWILCKRGFCKCFTSFREVVPPPQPEGEYHT
ncbi:uncharacterized protein LOC126235587 [Schistocerca nitens]|uniref:uncharacterized protein LOC126235587 n=1 Tax=Schistocerca nitens TaxID=7011 RepID=UPI0021176165|nr:uncharacterized protein LOC126235587 [Schistocerca nitens]